MPYTSPLAHSGSRRGSWRMKGLPEVSAIAIDGPVASGKTSVGRIVARRLGFRFLDTGLMYRAVTLAALRRRIAFDDEAALADLASSIDMSPRECGGRERLLVDGEDVTAALRGPAVERGVSLVSKVSGVRAALAASQRAIAAQGPIVMVGRDIGTVVLRDAPLKIYLDASIPVRARRRFMELEAWGAGVEYEQVVRELGRRDKIDSERLDSPARPAGDAFRIDTDERSVEELALKIQNLTADRRWT